MIKAIINGKEEQLTGYEEKLYIAQGKNGEKAVLNRRKYLFQTNDYFKQMAIDKKRQQFLRYKEKVEE